MRLAGVSVGRSRRPRDGASVPAAPLPPNPPQHDLDEQIAALRAAVEGDLAQYSRPSPVDWSPSRDTEFVRYVGLGLLLGNLAALVGIAAVFIAANW